MQWFTESEIKLSEEKTIHLQKEQRYFLLKVLFRSNTIDLDYKMELLEKEKSKDFSDLDVLEEQGCFASLPDDDSKFKLWDRYVKGQNFN